MDSAKSLIVDQTHPVLASGKSSTAKNSIIRNSVILTGGTCCTPDNCLSSDNLSFIATALAFEGVNKGVITHLLSFNWPIAKLPPV